MTMTSHAGKKSLNSLFFLFFFLFFFEVFPVSASAETAMRVTEANIKCAAVSGILSYKGKINSLICGELGYEPLADVESKARSFRMVLSSATPPPFSDWRYRTD